jgi:hypothetical protein
MKNLPQGLTMTETTETEQGDPLRADCAILLKDTAQGVDLQVSEQDTAGENSRAVHLAHWIGRNLEALVKLSQDDYTAQIERRKAAAKLLKPAGPRLVSHTGERLN